MKQKQNRMNNKRVAKNKRFVSKYKKHHSIKPKPFTGATSGMAVLYPRSAPEHVELINGPQAFLESCHDKLLADFGPNGSFIRGDAYQIGRAHV